MKNNRLRSNLSVGKSVIPLPNKMGRFSGKVKALTALTASVLCLNVGENARAATLTFDGDLDGSNGITDTAIGSPFSLTFGTTATFINPLISPTTLISGTSGDVFQFGGNGQTLLAPATVNVGTSSVAGLIFGATGGNAYNLSASSAQVLTIGTSGIVMNAAALPTTVGSANLGITLGGNQSWVNNSANAINIAGAITNGANLLTLQAQGAGDIILSGATTGATAGGITVNSSSTGRVILSGNNTHTGVTRLDAGILRATTSANALGTGTELRLTGGILQLTGGLAYNRNTIVGDSTNARTVAIQSDNTTPGVGATTTLGTLKYNNAATTINVTAGAFVTSGNAGVTFGAVDLDSSLNVLNTNNSFFNPSVTATTTLASVFDPFSVTFGGTGTTTITGNITSSGAHALTKNGTGILNINGVGNSPGTGTMTINAGTISIASGGTLGVRPLTFGGTGAFNFAAAAVGAAQSMGALTATAGEGTILSTYGTSGTAGLTFANLVARSAGATTNFTYSGGTFSGASPTNKITLTQIAGVAPVAGFINQGVFMNGADYAYYDTTAGYVRAPVYGTDANFVTQAGAATITGTPTAATHQQITGAITAAVTGSLATLKVNSASAANFTLTASNTLTLGQNGIIRSGGNGTTFASSTATAATLTGTGELVIRTNAAADAITFNTSNPVNITGFTGLTKIGAGTLTMANNTGNTFTGAINVNGGTLAFASSATSSQLYNNLDPAGAFGAAGARNIVLNGGTLSLTAGTFNPVASTKAIVIGAGGGTFNTGGGIIQLDDAAQLTGSGNLTISGTAGTVILGASSTAYTAFTGNTFVNVGTLRIANASGAGNAGQAIVVASGSTLDLVANGVVNNIFVGGNGISSGGAIISSTAGGGTAAASTTTLTANTTITTANGITLGGTVTDAGRGFGITKDGGGFLTLNGANTFSGGVTLSAINTGQLALGNNGALGSGPLTVMAGAAASTNIVASSNLVLTNNVILGANISFGSAGNTNVGNMTFGALDLGAGVRTINVPIPNMVTTFTGAVTNGTGLTVTGLGTLALAGTGSFTGPVTVNGGGLLSVGATTLNTAGSISIGTTQTSTLNFNADNVGRAANLASNTTVALGGTASQALLGFQLGNTSNYDSLNLSGATGNVTVGAGGVVISISPLTGFTPAAGTTNTYNLITTSGGGTISNFGGIALPVSALPTGYNYAFTTSSTSAVLGVTAGAAGNLFWRGDVNSSWNAGTGTGATDTNWNNATDTADALFAPNATNTVNFSSTGLAGAAPISTTLDQNFSIAGIVVNNTNTGALTVNQGTFGTLTLGTGGITVNTGGPTTTSINAPIALSGTQTWTVTDAGQTLSINASSPAQSVINGNSATIIKAGSGTLILGGFNTNNFGINLDAGKLNINSGGSSTTNSAIGTGAFTIAAGTTIDNTSGVAQALLTNNAQTWNGNFTFTGTNSLSMGSGGVNLGTAVRTVAVNGGNLQIGGIMSGAGAGIIKQGTGTLTLGGANTFTTGGVTLNDGKLNINAAAALGTGTFVINNTGAGVTIDNSSGAAVTTANVQTWSTGFTYGGSGPLIMNTGAIAAGSTAKTVVVSGPGLGANTNSLTIGGAITATTATGGLTKNGNGFLNLTGANGNMSNLTVVTLNAGTLGISSATALGQTGNTFVINGGAIDTTGAITLSSIPNQTWNSSFAFLGTNSLNMGAGGTITAAAGTTTISALANTLTLGAVISNTNTPAITVNGGGILALTGANLYTGTTTINTGATLNLGGGTATGSLNGTTGTALVLNGGVFNYSRTGTVTQNMAGVTIGSGRSVILNSLATQTTALGAITRTAPGGTLEIRPVAGSVISTSNTNTAGILGGWAVSSGGASWAVGNGAASVSALAYPSATTTTSTAAGTSAASYLGLNVDVDNSAGLIGGTIAPNSLRFNSATGFTMTLANGVNTIDSGGILVTPTVAGGVSTITGGSIAGSAGANGDLIINHWGTTGALNIDSIITDNPAGGSATSLTKSGNFTANQGIAVIGGSFGSAVGGGSIINTFTGSVFVDAGTLTVNGSSVPGGNLNGSNAGPLNQRPIILNGGILNLVMDGDATGTANAIDLTAGSPTNSGVTVNGNVAINVSRLAQGTALTAAAPTLFTQALNKTIQLGSLTFGNDGRTLTVTPFNGYGLEFTGTTTLDKNLTTINVATATASNVIQGLTLSGKVTGTIPGGAWTKAGAGTIVLNNATNDFASNMVLSAGVLAFNSDTALGNSANTITLTGTTAGTALRAFGGTSASPLTISTNRTINLWGNTAANNVIEVAANTTLTLNTAFGGGNSPMTKSDLGTLVLNADNGLWAGQLSITAGAVRVTNSGALGISTAFSAGNTAVAANQGAALQLAGVSIWDQITLTGGAGITGINNGGQLQAYSGTSTTNGLIFLATGAVTIGADSGATLNIRGGINGAQGLTFAGAGLINVDTNPLAQGTGGNVPTSITKLGSGTTTLAVASPTFVGGITVNSGTLSLGGSIGAGAGSVAGNGLISINPSGILSVDNSVGLGINNRLGGGNPVLRAITMQAGQFNYIGHDSVPSSETLGALIINRGESTITVTAGTNAGANLILGAPTIGIGGTALFRGSNLGSAPGNGVATIASTTTGFTFVGAGAAGTVTKGILPWALADVSATGTGTSFATADTGTGNLRVLNSSEYLTSLSTINTSANVANIVLGGADRLAGSSTINSLTLNSTGALTLNPIQTLTVGGGAALGGILNTAATTISGGFLTSGGAAGLAFHSNANLALDSVLVGTSGGSNPYLTKTGAGTLTLNKANPFIGQTAINQGTLKLAGGNNTLFYSSGNSYLAINAGGTLDLNGNSQQVHGLFSDAGYSTPTAIIKGVAGSTLVTNSDARNWAGVITGDVAFQRGGSASATSFFSDNDYSGPTLISGGSITLRDNGRLSGTSSIGLDFGGELVIDNQVGTIALADRVNDAAPITLRGGKMLYNGRNNNANNVEVMGALNLAAGANQFNMAAGTGVTTNELRFTSFSRNADATTNIQTANGQIGSAARLYFTGAEALLVNNILPWAAGGGQEFMSYNASMGFATIAAPGYAGYDGTVIPGSTQPTQNIRTAAAVAIPSSMGLNSLTITGAFNATFAGGGVSTATLNLTSGGLLKPSGGGNSLIGDVVDNGQLTAGGTADTVMDRLFIHSHANTLTINSRIVDNGTDAVRLIFTGYNIGILSLTNGANSYSGGTVVNGWAGNVPNTNILQLNGGVGQVVIPAGGLTLNNGAVTMATNGGQINAANLVTLNGPSTLTLVGTNSLAGLDFNVDGGLTNGPTVATGAGALTLTGGITAGGSNPNAVATISGAGGLHLNGNANYAMAVNGFSFNSQLIAPLNATLNITAPITGGGIVKTGDGLLSLGGTNTFNGGIDLQAGGIAIANNSALGTTGASTLTISGNNTTLTADATGGRVVTNNVILGNSATSITLGNYGAGTLALNGPITWSTATGVARTLNVNAVTGGGVTVNTQTLSGVITSAGTGNRLIKQGIGNLAITGNNAATLDWTGAQAVQILNGTLSIGADEALGAVPSSAVTNNIVINGGALAYTASYNLAGNRGISLGSANGVIDTSTFTNIISGTISGAGGLVKSGTGMLTLSGVHSFTGSVFANAGTLAFTNASAPTFTGVSVAGGATLNMLNNAGQAINLGSGPLNLGAGSGVTSLGLDLMSTGAYDSFTTSGAASTANTIILNMTRLSGATGGTFTLLSAASGLNNGSYVFNPAGWSISSTSVSPTSVQVTATPVSGDLFWAGAINLSWGGLDGSFNSNFSTDLAGTNAKSTPGIDQGLTFSANGLTATTLNTTLDINSSIRDLTFSNNVGSGPLGTVNIAPGVGGSLSITPTVSTAGISVQAGAPAAINISAPLILGGNQTWSVADPATVLSVSGNITGTANLTKDGNGILQLGGSNNYVGTTTISNGVLRAGATNGLNAGSAFTVGATGTLRLNGFSAAIGSLTGSTGGIVENFSATAATLTTGADNSNTTFAGTLQNGVGAGTFGLTKVGNGTLTLSGTYSHTGATTVNGGTLLLGGTSTGNSTITANNSGSIIKIGSANGLTALNPVTINAGTTFDLNGNSVSIGALTAVATSTITNSSSGTGASTSTYLNTPSGVGVYVDALNTATGLATLSSLITDGATRKTQITVNNANAGAVFSNAANSFTGGLVLLNNATGTRLSPGAVTGTPYGTGPIIIGQAATDKAGIYFANATTFTNPIVFNTALGTDRVGVRADAAITLSGKITANLAPATFTSNAATTGSVLLTGQVTGTSGIVLDITSLAAAATNFNVTLNNAGTPSDYAGDTVINVNPATAKSATLNLGAADQIPNGTGKGNVVINSNGTGIGTLNMAAFSETINGLTGNGSVTATGATLTLGDGNATAAFSGAITGGTVTKIGTGTQTFSGPNTFTTLNANNGFIAFATSPATSGSLGNTTTVNLNGGGISYTAAGTNALNRPIAIGGSDGTVDVLNAAGNLTITSVTSSGGNLIKTGNGTATLAGVTSLNGGLAGVTVNGGTLNAGFGTGGIATLNVGSVGNLSMQNSATEALTLGNAAGALTLAGGARLGFEFNGLLNDSITVGATGTAVTTAGVITLDLFNFGAGITSGSTYNIIGTTLGDLTFGGLTTYALGTVPSGFNYTLNATSTLVSLTAVTFSPAYWTNSQATGSWSTLNAGPLSNFSTDAGGATNLAAIPGSNETVYFSANGVAGPTVTTTLDGNITLYGLNFVAGSGTVTSVNIDQGSTGTLTVQPSTAAGGIDVGLNAGNITIGAPLVASNVNSPNQTWNVDGSASLTVNGAVTFNSGVIKTGAGTLTLGNAGNSGSGNFTLGAGTLAISAAGNMPTGIFTIGANTTINNTSGSAITLGNSAYAWNGSFTLPAGGLNLGSGPVTMNGDVTATISSAGQTLTVGGAVSNNGTNRNLTKAGPGTMVLNGTNTYGGTTTVNAGTLTLGGATTFDGLVNVVAGTLNVTGNNSGAGGVTLATGTNLNIGSSTALGTGTLTLPTGAVTIDTIAGNQSLTTANPQIWGSGGSLLFTGTDSLNMGTGAVSLGADASGAGYTLTSGTLGKTLTIAGPITSGNGGAAAAKTLTIAGAGNTTLSGNLTRGAAASLVVTVTSPGTTTISGAASSITTLNVNGGAASIVDLGAGNLTLTNSGSNGFQSSLGGTINATGGGKIVLGSGAGGNFLDNGTANGTTLTVNAEITGPFGFEIYTAAGNTGFTALTAQNTFTGDVAINGGNLSVSNIGNTGSTTSNLGQGAIISANGTGLVSGNSVSTSILRYTGTGEVTNRVFNLSGGTGGGAIEQAGTGLLKFTSNFTATGAGSKNLFLTGSTAGTGEIAGLIVNNSGANTTGVMKLGTGTWTLSGISATAASNYTGTTTLNQGTLAITHATTASLTGGLTFGAAAANTNVSTLDLTSGNATFAGAALVQTNTASANTITIGSGKTLTLNGGLTLGYDAGSGTGATNSKLTATGAGTLAVNGTTINISVNQAATNAAYFSTGTLDVSGLAAFTTNVTNFNIGVGSTTTGAGNVLLSNTSNTILATTLTVANTGGNNGNGTSTLTLGTGTNTIQADTIEIGKGKSSSPGVVTFASQAPASPGTVTITNKAGTGAANITVANVNAVGTAGGAIGTLDLRGHDATVNAGTLLISQNNGNNAGSVSSTNGTVSFDAGTFTVATLNMAPKTTVSTGSATATLNVGGGDFIVNTAFTLGSQATAGTSVATLNLTGGMFTSNAAITQGGGATTSTINLDGGTLDLTSHAIGSATNLITLNAKQGTLKNLTQLNGGAALTKTTTGTLFLTGTNTYSGATNITAGTLALSGGGVLADSNVVNLNAASTVFDISAITGTEVIGTLTGVASSTVRLGSKTLELSTNGDFAFGGSAEDGGLSGGTGGSIKKTGTGVMTLSGSNTYTGATNISGGTLLLGADNVLPNTAALNLSGGTTFNSGGFSDTTGPLGIATSATIDLGSGSTSLVTFTNTGAWSGLLSIWNYTGGAIWTSSTGDQLNFTSNGLTSGDLANIQFFSDNGVTPVGIGAGFIGSELVPVPEPTALAAALLLLGAIGFQGRRRPGARARRS